MNKTQIAERLDVRRPTIITWLSRSEYSERRGWKQGKPRVYDEAVDERICSLKRKRIHEDRCFRGNEYVRMDYAKTYPDDPLPSVSHVDRAVRDAGLQTRQPRPKKQKGGAEHLLFPKKAVRTLGTVHQSADFVGSKYILGSPHPVNIFATSYDAPFKLYQVGRVDAPTSLNARAMLLERVWSTHPLPHVFRIDNGLQFRGSARVVRVPGRFVIMLLNLGIVPLFAAPSLPYTNPRVEGNNRAFDELVWKRRMFTELAEVDAACAQLNAESAEFMEFRYRDLFEKLWFRYYDPARPPRTDTLHTRRRRRICFIRFPEVLDQDDNFATFVILNEAIRIPKQYAHQFVFVEWNLEDEQLSIFSEYKEEVTLIRRIRYKLEL